MYAVETFILEQWGKEVNQGCESWNVIPDSWKRENRWKNNSPALSGHSWIFFGNFHFKYVKLSAADR